MSWYLKVLQNYATVNGRATRSELWYFVLFSAIASVVLELLSQAVGFVTPDGTGGLTAIYYLGVLIPTLAVQVRRLHDIGKSGWWLLIIFIPLVGAIVLLVFFVKDSSPGDNEYGPNPKGETA